MNDLLISFIIPTFNEEEDIAKCIEAVLKNSFRRKEIIVVDSASTDNTIQIVRSIKGKQKINLIEEKKRNGVSAARNLGAKKAKGEILVFLNADVILNPDFCDKILHHYKSGADFVVCNSRVLNTNQPLGAFVQAQHDYEYSGRKDLVWSEGFSCRAECFKAVGGFKKFPKGSAGEDAALGFELEKKYNRVFDTKIMAPHLVTDDWKLFAKLRKERGKGSFFFSVLYLNTNPTKLFLNRFTKLLLGVTTFLLLTLVFPGIFLYIVAFLFIVLLTRYGLKSWIMWRYNHKRLFWTLFVLNILETVWSIEGFVIGYIGYKQNYQKYQQFGTGS